MTATKFDSRGGGVTAGTCDLRAKGHLKIGSSWGEWTCEEGFKGGDCGISFNLHFARGIRLTDVGVWLQVRWKLQISCKINQYQFVIQSTADYLIGRVS